jgi:hypothetical protein
MFPRKPSVVWARILGVCVAAGLAAGFLPQGKRTNKVASVALAPFEGAYDEALTRAVERNVPLLVVAVAEQSGVELDDDVRQFRDSLHTTPALAVAAQHAVVVLAGNTPHPPATIEVLEGGAKTQRTVCSVYRTASCLVHQKLFDKVYAEHNVEGEFKSPNVMVFGVDRKLARSWASGESPSWDAVLGVHAELRKSAGEGLTEVQYEQVLALQRSAQPAESRSEWGAAYLAWSKVLAITQTTKHATQAKEGQQKAAAELEKLRADARTGLGDGRAVESYKRLLELQREWAGTSFEKELAKDISAAEKHKDAKPAIEAYKRELDAEKVWSEALELLGANNESAAKGKLRTILRKYPGTPADKRVRERFADLAAEEDAKKGGG